MLEDIKSIKFFIRINNVPCHSFDDLQKNFYVQDVISLHRQGVLCRWLSVVGHKDKADALPAATEASDDIALGQKLVEVLCPDFDKNSLRAALDALGFEALAAEQAALAAQGQKNWAAFVTAYHGKFEELLQQASQRRSDFEFLCQTAICLVDNYWNLVEENVEKFIQRLFVEVPCLFFPLLAIGKFREQKYENTVRAILAEQIKNSFIQKTGRSHSWYENLCMQTKVENRYFYQVKKIIDSWDDIVQDNSKKIMVIYADSLAHVRPVRSRDDFTFKNIEKIFPIFDGLDYKSTNRTPLVAYIELPKCIAERIIGNTAHKKIAKNTPNQPNTPRIGNRSSK